MQNIQNTLTLFQRLLAPSPAFFTKIRNVTATLVAIGLGISQLETQLPFVLPLYISIFANKLVIIANAVAVLMSSMTVDVEAYKKKQILADVR